jgi:hypothetical protein
MEFDLNIISKAATAVYENAKQFAAKNFGDKNAQDVAKLLDGYQDYLKQKSAKNANDIRTFKDWVVNESAGKAVTAQIADKKALDLAIEDADKKLKGNINISEAFGYIEKIVKAGTKVVEEKAEEAKGFLGNHGGIFAGLIPLLLPFLGKLFGMGGEEGAGGGGGLSIMSVVGAVVVGLAADYFMAKDNSIVSGLIDKVTGKKKDGPTTSAQPQLSAYNSKIAARENEPASKPPISPAALVGAPMGQFAVATADVATSQSGLPNIKNARPKITGMQKPEESQAH